MFVISYSQLSEDLFYADFKVSYMPGLKVIDMVNAKVLINVDSKTAFVYSE